MDISQNIWVLKLEGPRFGDRRGSIVGAGSQSKKRKKMQLKNWLHSSTGVIAAG
jgi:hypothetical protein